MALWTPEEAWEYLNKWHYYMDEMEPYHQGHAVNELMKMTHRPWCRTHMASIAPNYGADCTCDGGNNE